MAVKRIEGTMDVVTAARQRILNTFANGVPVYMAFSAGKDSLCMSLGRTACACPIWSIR